MGRRREYTLFRPCKQTGCKEYGFYTFRTQSERADYQRRNPEEWACFKHSQPDEVLSADNLETQLTIEVHEVDGRHSFKELHNGVTYGPGFRAVAADLPVGAKITITAKLVLP